MNDTRKQHLKWWRRWKPNNELSSVACANTNCIRKKKTSSTGEITHKHTLTHKESEWRQSTSNSTEYTNIHFVTTILTYIRKHLIHCIYADSERYLNQTAKNSTISGTTQFTKQKWLSPWNQRSISVSGFCVFLIHQFICLAVIFLYSVVLLSSSLTLPSPMSFYSSLLAF